MTDYTREALINYLRRRSASDEERAAADMLESDGKRLAAQAEKIRELEAIRDRLAGLPTVHQALGGDDE